MTNFSVIWIVFVALLMSACNRGRAVDEWRVGGLYSTDDGKGQFSVVKILVLEPDAVHVRIYQQKFSSRPTSVDPTLLTLGKLGDNERFSIGHLPLSRKTFASWGNPSLSANSPYPSMNSRVTRPGRKQRVGCSDPCTQRQRPHSLRMWPLFMPATTYAPTHFRVQYHRPCGA